MEFVVRLLSYWKSGVIALLLACSPRITDRIVDALIDAGFEWAWRRWQLPSALADVWTLMEVHPVQSATLATLAWVVLAASFAARAVRVERPNRAFWEEMERAFALIPTEVDALGLQNTHGSVSWSVYPADKGDPRDRDRFLVEARRAGATLRQLPKLPRRYVTGKTADAADDWLNVVAALVHFASKIHGSGHTEEFGSYTSEHFNDVVRASQDACRMIANNETRRSSSPPSQRKKRRGRALLWTPSGFIDAPTE